MHSLKSRLAGPLLLWRPAPGTQRIKPPRTSRVEGGTLLPQPRSPRYPHRTEDRAQPRPPHSYQHPPSAATGDREQCLLGTFAEDAIEWKDGPLWEGQGLGCAGACGGARRLQSQRRQLCSAVILPSTHMLTYMHIYGPMVTQRQSMDHTNQGQDKKQKAPQPQVSGSLCHHCQALHGNTSALLTVGGAKRHMRSCTGQPGWGPSHPSVQASGKGATLAQPR